MTSTKRVVVVGASGMVGGYALQYLLDDPAVGEVTSIGRRNLGISDPKLTEILHPDFADCSALADVVSSQDAAVFCLGVYTGTVPDEALRRITVAYTVEFARVLRASSPSATFVFLSGSGADPTGRSRVAFARYKGEAESALSAAGFPRVYIFRPAYIYPVQPRGSRISVIASCGRSIPYFGCCSPIRSFVPTTWPGRWWTPPCEALKKADRWCWRTVTSALALA